MATDLRKARRKPDREAAEPEPAWDIARLFPPQGQWSEEDYFALDTNRLVELSDGFIEVLPMPTMVHQLIVVLSARRRSRRLPPLSTPKLGTTLFAGIARPSLEKQVSRARCRVHAGRARLTDGQ